MREDGSNPVRYGGLFGNWVFFACVALTAQAAILASLRAVGRSPGRGRFPGFRRWAVRCVVLIVWWVVSLRLTIGLEGNLPLGLNAYVAALMEDGMLTIRFGASRPEDEDFSFIIRDSDLYNRAIGLNYEPMGHTYGSGIDFWGTILIPQNLGFRLPVTAYDSGLRHIYIPHWCFLMPCMVMAFWAWRRERVLRRPGHCVKCGYNLTTNTTGICPECGARNALVGLAEPVH